MNCKSIISSKKTVSLLLVFVMILGCFFMPSPINAKVMKKKGVYYNTQKKYIVKFGSKSFSIKGAMMYSKKMKVWPSKSKKTRKGKKTFKLSNNVKCYISNPAGYEKMSKKEVKARMKGISEAPGAAYFFIFVKKGKVYKMIFTCA